MRSDAYRRGAGECGAGRPVQRVRGRDAGKVATGDANYNRLLRDRIATVAGRFVAVAARRRADPDRRFAAHRRRIRMAPEAAAPFHFED